MRRYDEDGRRGAYDEPFHGPGGWRGNGAYGAGGGPRDRGAWSYRGLDDETLRLAVRTRLFEDTWLDARGIAIRVEDGVVTLTGEVKDHLEARYAWDDAWQTPGVRGVISRIEVGGVGPRGQVRGESGEEPG